MVFGNMIAMGYGVISIILLIGFIISACLSGGFKGMSPALKKAISLVCNGFFLLISAACWPLFFLFLIIFSGNQDEKE